MVPEWIAALILSAVSLIGWIPVILVLTVVSVAIIRIAVCRDAREALRPFVE